MVSPYITVHRREGKTGANRFDDEAKRGELFCSSYILFSVTGLDAFWTRNALKFKIKRKKILLSNNIW